MSAHVSSQSKAAHHGTPEAGDAVLVYSTFPGSDAAEATARALVESGLVACANIIPAITSIFIWQGEVQREQEVAMIMKTRAGLADRAVAAICERHPYDTPAIVVLPIVSGSQPFLDWITTQTAAARGGSL